MGYMPGVRNMDHTKEHNRTIADLNHESSACDQIFYTGFPFKMRENNCAPLIDFENSLDVDEVVILLAY